VQTVLTATFRPISYGIHRTPVTRETSRKSRSRPIPRGGGLHWRLRDPATCIVRTISKDLLRWLTYDRNSELRVGWLPGSEGEIRLTTMIWSTIRAHRRCPALWVASGIEADSTSQSGRARRRLLMTIHRAPHTWVSLYTRMLACDDTDYLHLHPRGPPRSTRVISMAIRERDLGKRLLHLPVALCIGIVYYASRKHAFGGPESVIIDSTTASLSGPSAAISIFQLPIEAGFRQDIDRRATMHCGTCHRRP
jgi:hypothetical protein